MLPGLPFKRENSELKEALWGTTLNVTITTAECDSTGLTKNI